MVHDVILYQSAGVGEFVGCCQGNCRSIVPGVDLAPQECECGPDSLASDRQGISNGTFELIGTALWMKNLEFRIDRLRVLSQPRYGLRNLHARMFAVSRNTSIVAAVRSLYAFRERRVYFIGNRKLRVGFIFAQEYECAILASGTAAYSAGLVDSARGDYEQREVDTKAPRTA